MYFPTVLPTIVQSIVDNNITFPFGCYCSRRGGSLDSGHGHTDHAIYRVSQKNALSELCCSTVLPILQPSFISWLDESEYLLARYEWRLEDWEEQHGSESAFFWDTLYSHHISQLGTSFDLIDWGDSNRVTSIKSPVALKQQEWSPSDRDSHFINISFKKRIK